MQMLFFFWLEVPFRIFLISKNTITNTKKKNQQNLLSLDFVSKEILSYPQHSAELEFMEFLCICYKWEMNGYFRGRGGTALPNQAVCTIFQDEQQDLSWKNSLEKKKKKRKAKTLKFLKLFLEE